MTVPQPEPDILRSFSVYGEQLVAETELACVWRVQGAREGLAALKVYRGRDVRNEGPGISLLEAWQGEGAAQLYDRAQGALLLEWLEGPSLGDLSRGGRDDEANAHLVEVANRLHAQKVRINVELPRLESWFDGLMTLQFSPQCRAGVRRNIEQARSFARELLASEHDLVPLHGDLHHDNVRLGERGYCPFDAKGVFGERAYELANAFRNPKDAPELVRDPERAKAAGEMWSVRFGVDQKRLHRWAAAKCALSIAWRSAGELEDDAELDLLERLLSLAQ